MITVDVEDGWPYLIRIGGRAGQSGQGTLVIDDGACLPPAANDDCGSGATIEEGSFAFSTIGATTDGPPEAACGEAEIANDVWYRFLATCDDVATVRVCDVDFDARVAVYEGTCPGEPGLALDCAADGCGDGVTLTFPISAGSIYRIRVGSSDGATGAGSLELLCGEPPPTCLGDTDGNGAVDVDDLVAVILDWGTDGVANGTDIDGSGLVDVDDLVAVILAWGQCP